VFTPEAIRIEKKVKRNQKAKNALNTFGSLIIVSRYVAISFAEAL
jgi:hypothetical protein